MATADLDGDEQGGDSRVLARFPRRNPETGFVEETRIDTYDRNGRLVTHIRRYYLAAKTPTPDDDGWRPSKQGEVIREGELDQAIEALVRARDLVHSEGRATCPAAPGERNLRPKQVARVLALVEAGGVEGLSERDRRVFEKMQANLEHPR
jgi:hypothetical protein